MNDPELQHVRPPTSRRALLRSVVMLGAAGALGPGVGIQRTAPAAAANPIRSGRTGQDPTKTASTIYTPQRVAGARQNIQDFDWAQTLRDEAVAAAEPLLEQGDEWVWSLVTGQKVARNTTVSWPDLGSLTSGMEIYKDSPYPWPFDV